MTREVNGVQTWHDYAATTEHGALYTETVETRVNGEAVPGQSTRTTTWITAEGSASGRKATFCSVAGNGSSQTAPLTNSTRRTDG